MKPMSIFLDPQSCANTANQYGLVSTLLDDESQQRFSEQYINKEMLLENLQNRLNQCANDMCNLPEGAELSNVTSAWIMGKSILDEIKIL